MACTAAREGWGQVNVRTSQHPRCRTAILGTAAAAIFLLLFTPALRADPKTARDARSVASAWLSAAGKPLGAELAGAIKDVRAYRHGGEDNLYYVVSLDPEGFVIVSADDLVEPIIAFSDEGEFDPSPENALYSLANRDIRSRIDAVRVKKDAAKRKGVAFSPEGASKAARGKWSALLTPRPQNEAWTALTGISDPRVDRFMFSKWSQTNECTIPCYNYYTPPNAPGTSTNYPCGCVATSMAQLMRYWQYPTAGVGTASFNIAVCGSQESRSLRGGDGNGGPYDWSNMVLDPDCSTTTVQRQAIGAVTHDAAVAVGMDFCSGGSGITDLMRIVDALQNTFMFSNAKLQFDNEHQLPTEARNRAINSNLHAGHPVLLGIIGNSVGHVVVCDGYGYNNGSMYHHLNMGWGGSWTAWYNLPIVDSSPSYDTVAGVMYNIFRSGSGEIIAGRVTDSAGNPIQGATVRAGSFEATTSNRGAYALTNVASATQYSVTVEKAGYTFFARNETTGTSIDGTTMCGNLCDVDFVAQLGSVVTDQSTMSISEGGSAILRVKLSAQPPAGVTVTVARVSGDSDITIESGGSLSFDSTNWSTYQNVTVCAAQDADGIDGSATIDCTAPGWIGAGVTVTENDNDRKIVTDVNAVSVNEGDTAQFNVKLAALPAGDVVVSVARESGDTDITVQSGASLTFTTGNWDTYQPVTVAAAPDPDYVNGSAIIRCAATDWASVDVTATESDSAGPPDTSPPTMPTGLAAAAQSQTRVNLSWTASTDNIAVAGYKVFRNGAQIGTSAIASYADLSCSADTAYSYSVLAYDGSSNESEQCPAVNVTTFPYIHVVIDEEATTRSGPWNDGQPAAPPAAYEGDYKFTMSAAGETAWAKWTPNLTRPGNWAVYVYYREGTNRTNMAPYTVYYNGGSQTYQVDQTAAGGQWVYLTTKLFLAGTSGYVKLGNATGETSKVIVADAVRFSFVSVPPGTDTDPPSVPAGLMATGASASKVDLQWTASTDNVAVSGYRVFRDGLEIGISTSTAFSDTTCQPSTPYQYSVCAYDSSGNESAQCTAIPVTTPASTDIIMDEEVATFYGSWQGNAQPYQGAYNEDHQFTMSHIGGETSWARWTPTIPTDGNYQVYVWYASGTNRSVKAPYTIWYRGGYQTYEVNQRETGGQWVYLATKPFVAGTSGYVHLGNGTDETSMAIIADAVKFSYAGPLPDPPPVPTDIAPTVNSPTSITWRWNDVAGETGYRVKDSGGVVKSADLPAGTTQWTEENLASNTAYTRRTYAFNVYGESGGSVGQGKYTLARAGESTDGTGATGNVWCTSASKNTWYGPGKTFIFSNPAGFGTGGTWKASKFEYKWNKNDVEAWTTAGTPWTTGTISLSANAGDGCYYLHVRAFNGNNVANNTHKLDYGPFYCDVTAPLAVTVTDQGAWTPSQTALSASWSASSDGIGSDINRYEYAIGSTPTTQNVRGWTSAGTALSVAATGLSLTTGQEYFIQVRAVDNVGLVSAADTSDGITVAPSVSRICQAWPLANTVDGFALRDRIVTAVVGGAFWLEESDRTAAIKVISNAAVTAGNTVTVAGILEMSGTQRAMFADIVENYGGSGPIPAPLAMSQRSLGGGPFNAATPGVTGGVGLYNIGLLVRCSGAVTYSDTSNPADCFFYLDDGSGLASDGHAGVLVRCGSVTPPTSGAVSVTGLIGSESADGRTVPVLIIRNAADITAY